MEVVPTSILFGAKLSSVIATETIADGAPSVGDKGCLETGRQ